MYNLEPQTICPQCDGHGHFDRALYGRVTCESCWGRGHIPMYNIPFDDLFVREPIQEDLDCNAN